MQTKPVDVTGAGNEQVSQWTPPSWEEVVREHSGRVYRLAFRLTGNSHDAEDLTQEVFVRVFRSLSTYSPGTFEGWLHRITTNLFLDMTRRRQRIRFEGLGEETAAKLRGAEPTPSQAFDERHLDFDISAALADNADFFARGLHHDCQYSANRIRKGDVGYDTTAEKSIHAMAGAIEELIRNDEIERLMLFLERYDC